VIFNKTNGKIGAEPCSTSLDFSRIFLENIVNEGLKTFMLFPVSRQLNHYKGESDAYPGTSQRIVGNY
jgi:hypothetical protein